MDARAGSGFDTFLIEGYQYPGINHNLDQATRCAQYPWKELAWDQAHCRYLMGLYYGTGRGCGVRKRQPPRTPGHQALGLRPCVPVRLAGAARRPATTARLSTDHIMEILETRLSEAAQSAVRLEQQTGCPRNC